MIDLRLNAIVDPERAGGRSLADLAAAVVRGGATLVQLRDKLGTTRRMVEEARAVRAVLAGVPLVINDRLDSGVSQYIAGWLSGSNLSPLFLGWLIAAVIRVCVGSATVAGLTAAGIILPVVSGGTVNAELMVLSIGAGSLMLSHVNDVGFWMYKEYFTLSLKDTFLTWTDYGNHCWCFRTPGCIAVKPNNLNL